MSEQAMTKILVVDDEEILRTRLKNLLDLDGFETHLAKDGREGLIVFDAVNPDVAIVDVRMPVMDGLEVLKEIRGRSTHAEVIVLTGHGGIETAVQAMKDGAFVYIEKPVEYDQLLIEIQRALAKQKIAADQRRAAESLRESKISYPD